MEYTKEFQAYRQLVNEESRRIYDVLVQFVKKNGGEIDTSNEDNSKDTIYAIVYDESSEHYTDYKVGRVGVTNDCLEVYIPNYSESEDVWFSVYGGMVMVTDTLYSLCECLPEYVNKEQDYE